MTKSLLKQVRALIEHHQKCAEHFRPFGETNPMTVFHTKAVETLTSVSTQLQPSMKSRGADHGLNSGDLMAAMLRDGAGS
jgi:hypothetical protein